MSLNIKNERVHALAREAAARTGKSQTAVIQEALERLLDDLDDDGIAARQERAREWLRSLPPPTEEERRAMQEFQDDMYDEWGLPK